MILFERDTTQGSGKDSFFNDLAIFSGEHFIAQWCDTLVFAKS